MSFTNYKIFKNIKEVNYLNAKDYGNGTLSDWCNHRFYDKDNKVFKKDEYVEAEILEDFDCFDDAVKTLKQYQSSFLFIEKGKHKTVYIIEYYLTEEIFTDENCMEWERTGNMRIFADWSPQSLYNLKHLLSLEESGSRKETYEFFLSELKGERINHIALKAAIKQYYDTFHLDALGDLLLAHMKEFQEIYDNCCKAFHEN